MKGKIVAMLHIKTIPDAILEENIPHYNIDGDIESWDMAIRDMLFEQRNFNFKLDEDFPLLVFCAPIQLPYEDVMKLEFGMLRNLLFQFHKIHPQLFLNGMFKYTCKYEEWGASHRLVTIRKRRKRIPNTPPRKPKPKRARVIDSRTTCHLDAVQVQIAHVINMKRKSPGFQTVKFEEPYLKKHRLHVPKPELHTYKTKLKV
jgi:hypothetical protein